MLRRLLQARCQVHFSIARVLIGIVLFLSPNLSGGTTLSSSCIPAKPGRYALVIGNSNYRRTAGYAILNRLPKVADDAKDMASALCSLGFEVDLGLDETQGELVRAVERLRDKAAVHSVRLFYFSGHALQQHDENYLLPVDAKLRSARDVERQTLNLAKIYAALESESLETPKNIVILDACRDNRFTSTRSLVPGLALPIDVPLGTVVAFATAPGTKALAAIKDWTHSPYTEALLRHIREPGLTLPDFFDEVRKTLLQASNKLQIPWENSSALDSIYLAEPVHAEWRIDEVDDLVGIRVSHSPILERTEPSDWVTTSPELLRPGSNRFEIFVYNDKTYRKHDAIVEKKREGWKYSVRLRINGKEEITFSSHEDEPPLERWGHMFTVRCGSIDVNPRSGEVSVLDSGCTPEPSQTASPSQWQNDIDWCTTDTGLVDCPEQYRDTENVKCLESGGRKCLLENAIHLAKENKCNKALEMAITCQCHNKSAAMGIEGAGETAVCDYLAKKP
jgi:hypothetical protein